MLRAFIGLTAAAVIAGANAGAAGAAVKNGSFESPRAPQGDHTSFTPGERIGAWKVVGPARGEVAVVSGAYTNSGFAFPAQAGQQWLDLTGWGANTNSGVEQSVKTVRGRRYAVSFAVGNIRGGAFGTTSTITFSVNGKKLKRARHSAGAGTQTWKRFVVKFEATKNSTRIRFVSGDGSQDSSNGLDAVSIKPA